MTQANWDESVAIATQILNELFCNSDFMVQYQIAFINQSHDDSMSENDLLAPIQ